MCKALGSISSTTKIVTAMFSVGEEGSDLPHYTSLEGGACTESQCKEKAAGAKALG
jgi:hypothetical protein